MLQEIAIRNFALIDSTRLVLAPGLNVLTGETGAGKSILIDAVEIALGGRASSDVVRTGTDRALIEVVFDIMGDPALRRLVADLGLAQLDDPVLVISREIPLDGRSTCRVNGRAMSLTGLREITQHLIDIHGQHEHQSLLEPERHLGILDAFGGEACLRLRDEVAGHHRAWQTTLGAMRELAGDERDRARRVDLLGFQVGEIEEAKLKTGEEDELMAARRLLASAEKRREAAARAYSTLYTSDSPGRASAHDLLGQALAALEELAALDGEVVPMLEAVRQAAIGVDEVSRDLRRYRDNVLFEPREVAAVEARLDLINTLKRKYGRTVEEVIAFGRSAREELERLTGSAARLAELEDTAERQLDDLRLAAARLSDLRREIAAGLGREVEVALGELEMRDARFEVEFRPVDPPAASGAEEIEFLFSANAGEPVKPLSRIASGGEMSRVMLALKAILAEVDHIPTVLFDEIDAGVGGGAAQAVAEKLAAIALTRQVVCVTHLARIASLADAHHHISKATADGRTETRVTSLDAEQREHEVARMLAGHPPTPITLAHAREMLEQGRQVKDQLRASRLEAAGGR